MMSRFTVFILFLWLSCGALMAQDTLPAFSVTTKPGNRNLVSWVNNFPHTSQISIQRSADSLKNFKTIVTVPDPGGSQNGYLDTKAAGRTVFYRLFIVLDGGKYYFTGSKKPVPDTASSEPALPESPRLVADSLNSVEVSALKQKLEKSKLLKTPVVSTEKFFVVKKYGVYRKILERNFKRFQDSIVRTTRDTIVFISVDSAFIKPYAVPPAYTASRYVYTEKHGDVMISLPDAKVKKYSIRFFEENKAPIFELEEVPSTTLIVDKTNFVHAGWFWFELYENGVLKERHKFFIPKDF